LGVPQQQPRRDTRRAVLPILIALPHHPVGFCGSRLRMMTSMLIQCIEGPDQAQWGAGSENGLSGGRHP
jgi:hypothetical protein